MFLRNLFFLATYLIFGVSNESNLIAQNQDAIDYQRGGVYYPEEKLSNKDTLTWPIKYNISLKIEELRNINIDNPYFDADFYYEITSKYDTVFIKKDKNTIGLNPISDDWVTINGIVRGGDNITKQDIQLNKENEGLFVFSRGIDAKINHKWDLKTFPFDKQKLKFSFITQADTSIVRLSNSLTRTMNFKKDNEFLSDGYIIDTMYSESAFIKSNEIEEFSPLNKRSLVFEKVTYVLELSRGGSWLYVKLFFGGFLSFLISWIIFLIPKKLIDARTNLAAASIFGALGNKYFVEESLPNVQILMKADIINNVIILLIIFNILMMVSQTSKKMKWPKVKSSKHALIRSGVVFILVNLIILWW